MADDGEDLLADVPPPPPTRRMRLCTHRAKSSKAILALVCDYLSWVPDKKKRKQSLPSILWSTVAFHPEHRDGCDHYNRVPGALEACRKGFTSLVLRRMQALFGEELYSFYPRTYVLPGDSEVLAEADAEAPPGKVYIVKPDAGSQGDGIQLTAHPCEYAARDTSAFVVQEYVTRPLLLDGGRKFDFRLYALVCFEPFRVYLCREGLARFATTAYEPPRASNLRKAFMHLTNYSLNARSDNYSDDDSKRPMSAVLAELGRLGFDVPALWAQMHDIVARTALAIAPWLEPQDPERDFALLGVDVLVDADGRAWLLELNQNPSLRTTVKVEVSPGVHETVPSRVDRAVKLPVLADALRIVADPASADEGSYDEVWPADRADDPLYAEVANWVDVCRDVGDLSDSDGEGGEDGEQGESVQLRLRRLNRLEGALSLDEVPCTPSRRRQRVAVALWQARGSADVLRLCAEQLGWPELEAEPATHRRPALLWSAGSYDAAERDRFKFYNRVSGMLAVCRKRFLSLVMRRMQLLHGDAFGFYPRTYVLPEDADRLPAAQRGVNWIVKPDAGSQGDGIVLVHSPRDYVARLGHRAPDARVVIQEYLARPLLLDGIKFDFRVYVLVRTNPLRVHVCREGLARFATMPYEAPCSANLRKAYMHLTNYSLNKYSDGYKHASDDLDDDDPDAPDADAEASKRTLSSVLDEMARLGHDVDVLWQEIQELVAQTVVAIDPWLEHESGVFQILGFDVLVDEDAHPWLLEVNHSPSLSIVREEEVEPGIFETFPSAIDEAVKMTCVGDALRLGVLRAADEEPPTSYTEVYPADRDFSRFQIVHLLRDVFNKYLGRRRDAMASREFVKFGRECAAESAGLRTADLDIIYRRFVRIWDAGGLMDFAAFMDAVFYMAAAAAGEGEPLADAIEEFIELSGV